jgi:hypothetical protein
MPPATGPDDATPALAGLAPEMPFAESRVVVAAPALLVEARFRGVPLASRLLRADDPRTFTVGAARRADAPVNPAYLSASTAAADSGGHVLVEPFAGGFAVNLAPAMRAELVTPAQALPLRPDFGRAEAPLALPADAYVHVNCGEVAFDLFAAEPAAAVPAPRFLERLREHARYDIGVALAFLALMLIVRAIPEDPRSLSDDYIGRSSRLDHMVTIPLTVDSPEVPSKIDNKTPGGGGPQAAKGESGKAGSLHAPHVSARRTVAGQAKEPHDVAGEIRKNSILSVLDGVHSGDVGAVFDDKPAIGPDMKTLLGDLVATNAGDAWGPGLGPSGTGAGGGGTGEHTVGNGRITTLGRYGDGTGVGPGKGYGTGIGTLGTHHAKVPDPILGVASVRGTLDKEIIRRIVRRHLNEVKYCYDQALVKQPKLDGRLVAQFTIAGNGQVIASLKSSSTLGSPAVEMCVVNAIKRWEFPAPTGGGLAIVTYPFTFSPAGN